MGDIRGSKLIALKCFENITVDSDVVQVLLVRHIFRLHGYVIATSRLYHLGLEYLHYRKTVLMHKKILCFCDFFKTVLFKDTLYIKQVVRAPFLYQLF